MVGHTPLALSPLVAGAWRLADWQWTPQQRLAWIEGNLDIGVTSFDHADIYGGYTVEALFGEALALSPSLRSRLQIVTKCDILLLSAQFPQRRVKHYDTTPAHIRASVQRSLRRLHIERLDMLLLHRPDPLMDADAIARSVTAAGGAAIPAIRDAFGDALLTPQGRFLNDMFVAEDRKSVV